MENFSKATDDILEFILVPFCPLDFLGVSKKWKNIAKQHAHQDLRLDKKLVQKAIVSACKYGDLAKLKNFFAHKLASPTADGQDALCTAIYFRRNEIAKYILENVACDPGRKWLPSKKRTDLSVRQESPIEIAVRNHNREMVDYFLSKHVYPVLQAAISKDENLAWEIIEAKEKYNLHMDGQFLVDAITHNRKELFQRLMKFPEISFDRAWSYIQSYHYNTSESWPFLLLLADPRFELTDVVIKFCMGKCKTMEEFEAVIARKGHFQPSAEILDNAIQSADISFVKFLLQRPGWEKATQSGFSSAAYRGNLEIIDLLIEHGVKNESNCKEALTSLAYSGKHPEIIAKLMQLVSDFPFHNTAMQALDSKDDDVALVFLQHPKMDLVKEDQIYLRRACEYGLPKTVKFLLGQPKVNPTVQDSVPLRSAALNGHLEVVKLLMEDGRVDPAAKANHAIQCAALSDNIEIVAILLADERVNPSVNGNYAYTKAKSKEVRELLLKDERVRSKVPK
jgi:ankyrin repeat protein